MNPLCFAVLGGLMVLASCAGPGRAPARGPLKVLVITGGHKFDREAFPKLFENQGGMKVEIKEYKGSPGVFDDIRDWDYDVIVQYNFKQKITKRQRKNFLELLDRGVGLVVLHHAISAYPAWHKFDEIIGATYVLKEAVRDGRKYVMPKWKNGVTFRVHVEDPSHPILAGAGDFDLLDETYKLWVYHEGNHLLLSTGHPTSNRQLAWTRTYGKARVVFMQPGHGLETFTHTGFREILGRAIRWTAGLPLERHVELQD